MADTTSMPRNLPFSSFSMSPTGQRWVISDIHGYAQTFQTLVREKIKLTRNDQLFLLGDYIDRGPDSVGG